MLVSLTVMITSVLTLFVFRSGARTASNVETPSAKQLDAPSDPPRQVIEASRKYRFNILQVDSSSYPNINVHFSLLDESGDLAKDLSMDAFALSNGANSIPLEAKKNAQESATIVFVDTSMIAQERGLEKTRSMLQDYIGHQPNWNRFIEVMDPAGVILPYSKMSNNTRSSLPEFLPKDGASLYSGLYQALLWTSYRQGPKTFTAIISSADNGSGRPLADVVQLSKETGLPINVIATGNYDEQALSALTLETGGLMSLDIDNAQSELQNFQSVWDTAITASFRIDDSWLENRFIIQYAQDKIFADKSFSAFGIQPRSVEASSIRAPVDGISYGPANAVDQSSDTAWIEGSSTSGEGEWIEIQFFRKEKISSVLAQNGYWKNAMTMANNGRIKTFEIEFADGTELVSFPDPAFDPGSFSLAKGYEISLDKTHYSDYAKVTIKEIFPERMYFDTCLSYIGFHR
jgi:hypothetical protein